ncbi:MAG: sulfatase-like hydrolase/transferase [Myxococcota bacterium]
MTRLGLVVAMVSFVIVGAWSRLVHAHELGIAVLSTTVPSRFCPGERRGVPLTVRNVGQEAWDPAKGDRLAYHWLDPSGEMVERDGHRTLLPGPIEPAAAFETLAHVEAPAEPGRYRLQWALVREQVDWVHTGDPGVETEVGGSGPPLSWRMVAGGQPEPMRVGETGTASLTVRNDGCSSWAAEQGDHMAYHWYDADGRVVEPEGLRSPMPALGPGEEATFDAKVLPPLEPGDYVLQWHPVREGQAWFPEQEAMAAVSVGDSAWAWSMHMLEPFDSIAAGEVADFEVWLRHDGLDDWSTAQGDAFSYRWLDADGAVVAEGARVSLPSPWLPGDAALVTAKVVAPAKPGQYTLAWEPVRENVRWFGAASTIGDRLAVEVTTPRLGWAVEQIEVPSRAWVARQDTVPVVLRNTGAEAWDPARGDGLSYRWYDADGETLLSDGMRTVLPGVVEPGETVALDARVRGPLEPGQFVLGLEMVREHVRWYGAPTAGQGRMEVRVERWSSYLVTLLGAAGIVLVVALRRRPAPGPAWWVAWRVGPALWCGLAMAVVVHCFVDLSGAEPWEGRQWVVIGPGFGLALAVLPWSPRIQAWAGAVVLGLCTFIALADLAYLHFFGSIVPISAVWAVHHLSDAEATVSSLLQPSHGWLVTVPILAIGLAIAWPGRLTDARPPARRRRILVAIGLGVLLGAMPMVRTFQKVFSTSLGRRVFNEEDNVGRLGVVGAHLFQVIRELRDLLGPDELTGERAEVMARELAERREARAQAKPQTPGFGAAEGYDVVLIQVEALQQWVIGASVQGQEVTPFLNAATHNALYFDQVFDQTAQGRTSDAEYLVLGAGHPPARGALAFQYQDNDFYTVAHVLADRGYTTFSAHPYKRGFWNRARIHPRYGFGSSRFRREFGPGPMVGWGLSDEAFLERMTPDIVGAPRPSLTFMITLSLHHPYDSFPSAFKRLDLGGLEGHWVGNYLHAMHHFDVAFETLMTTLEEEGRLEHTLVVLYGDHVTGMEEPPEVLAFAGRETWDPGAHVALHRVPVFFWVGDSPPEELRGQRNRVGGHVDIGPTTLHLLGIDDPRPAALGRPLLEPGPGFAVLSSGGAVDAELALAMAGEGIPREGTCFERHGGRSVALERCASLAARAEVELEIARELLTHDVHRAPPE